MAGSPETPPPGRSLAPQRTPPPTRPSCRPPQTRHKHQTGRSAPTCLIGRRRGLLAERQGTHAHTHNHTHTLACCAPPLPPLLWRSFGALLPGRRSRWRPREPEPRALVQRVRPARAADNPREGRAGGSSKAPFHPPPSRAPRGAMPPRGQTYGRAAQTDRPATGHGERCSAHDARAARRTLQTARLKPSPELGPAPDIEAIIPRNNIWPAQTGRVPCQPPLNPNLRALP